MARRMVRSRQRYRLNKKAYFIIAGIIVAIAIVLCIILLQDQQIQAQTGEVPFQVEGDGVVVRSEKLYKAENYGKAVFIADEGQAIAQGEQIAEVYRWGYTDKIESELSMVQEKIMDYQENNLLKGIIDTDLNNLNEQIEKKTEEIQTIVNGEDTGDLLQREKELKQLMNQRTTLLKDSVVADDTLQDLYDQEQKLLERVADLEQTITAEEDGVVSFYFDGAETLLTPENMLKLSKQNVDDILAGRVSSQITDTTADRPLYRLVDANLWYVMYVSDQPIDEFTEGSTFTVTFKEVPDTQYTGKVVNMKEDQGQYLYYFSFEDDVTKVLNLRRVEMTVQKTYSGILVPKEAIKERDGVTGVEVLNGNETTFVPVNVLIEENDQCVIEPTDTATVIEKGSVIIQ